MALHEGVQKRFTGGLSKGDMKSKSSFQACEGINHILGSQLKFYPLI